jgi:soluble P-type ATPase
MTAARQPRQGTTIATVALVAVGVAVALHWERAIRERLAQLAAAGERLTNIGDALREREEIASAMFVALADARSALLATVENLGNMPTQPDAPTTENGETS